MTTATSPSPASAGSSPKPIEAEALGRRTMKIWRGNAEGGGFKEYHADVSAGMVVLDAVHQVQATQAGDLACRWNCKAGKCGSCSAEINGKPRLMCMTRIESLPAGAITIQPMKAFKPIKDLVTDVSWNYQVKKTIAPFKPKAPESDGTWRMQQYEVERVQEFRKCIECFLCQDTCHVLRDHGKHEQFAGPRFFVHSAQLEMHPLDTVNARALAGSRRPASASATSPSAAPRSARSTSTSPTMPSSRSRSGWRTPTMTR